MVESKIFFIVLFTTLSFVYCRRVKHPCEKDFKIPCDNGQCIDNNYWCDGEVDCNDRSDESFCLKGRPSNCTDKHFDCGDGKCIPKSLRCNVWGDCDNGSDEKNCDRLDEPSSSSTKEPISYFTTTSSTTTTEMPTSSSVSSYQSRRRDENDWYNQYGPRELHTTTVTVPYFYLPPTIDYHPPNNQENNQRGYRPRGSDTYPNRSFPGSQQPISPPRRMPQVPTTTDTRQYPSNYPYERPVIQPPRSILFPPRLAPSSSSRRNVKRPIFFPFYFTKNYTEEVAYRFERNIQYAKEWLVAQRDKSYNWGIDTPRALIALSLIHNSFTSDVEDNELMRKGLQTHLGIKLLRNNTGIEKMGTTRLAMYINALLATCQNPHDFLGVDLVEDLYFRQNFLEKNQIFINPIIYLTLCLTDKYVPTDYLQTFLEARYFTEISKDFHILATAAMACVAQRNPDDPRIRAKLHDAALNLLNIMNRTEGSFGSKYSTALAAQALMSVNESLSWEYEKTLDYLAKQQQPDGSFGDMQSTYYTLIALSGRSLVHLRNTQCDPVDVQTERTPDDILNAPGPKKSILYTLRVGYPETFSAGMQLSVPNDTTFFDIMRVAAYQDPRFKFNYEISKGNLYNVHTIANIPNDPERAMFWTLYWMKPSDRTVDLRHRFLGNIIDLIPLNGDDLIFWYLNDIY